MLSGCRRCRRLRRSGGVVSWCRSWPRCCRSPASRLVSGFIWASWHYPDHRGRLPECRPSAVVLAADVHVRRGRDQLHASLAAAEEPTACGRRSSCTPATTSGCWSIFAPLTSDREYTKWIAGDLGLAFVVVAAAVVAMVFWLNVASYRRNRLGRSRFSRPLPVSPRRSEDPFERLNIVRPARPGCADHSGPHRPPSASSASMKASVRCKAMPVMITAASRG